MHAVGLCYHKTVAANILRPGVLIHVPPWQGRLARGHVPGEAKMACRATYARYARGIQRAIRKKVVRARRTCLVQKGERGRGDMNEFGGGVGKMIQPTYRAVLGVCVGTTTDGEHATSKIQAIAREALRVASKGCLQDRALEAGQDGWIRCKIVIGTQNAAVGTSGARQTLQTLAVFKRACGARPALRHISSPHVAWRGE
jgi:hypothetical protein